MSPIDFKQPAPPCPEDLSAWSQSQAQLTALEQENNHFKSKLETNSKNSSLPHSRDSIANKEEQRKTREQKSALPENSTSSKRKRGAQPGHIGRGNR